MGWFEVHLALAGIRTPEKSHMVCLSCNTARGGVWIQAPRVCALAKAWVTQPLEGLKGSSLLSWSPFPSEVESESPL